MGEDFYCDKCGYWRGHPNTFKRNHWVFVCTNCKMGYDDSEERAEARMGA